VALNLADEAAEQRAGPIADRSTAHGWAIPELFGGWPIAVVPPAIPAPLFELSTPN
jgi:hypothetical protein